MAANISTGCPRVLSYMQRIGAWGTAVAALCGLACVKPSPRAGPRTAEEAPSCASNFPTSTLKIVAGPATSVVSGVVVLQSTGIGLPDAIIQLDPPHGPVVKSAANGGFDFGSIARGRHSVIMRRIGVRTLRDSLTVPVIGALRVDAVEQVLCDEFGIVVASKH